MTAPTWQDRGAARTFGRYLGRALRLRCPHCGEGRLLVHWFRLHDRCPVCGLALERGDEGYQVGSYTLNIVGVELLFALCFVGIAAATWPDVPWTLLQYGGGALMVVGPLLAFPFARAVFLACDLMMRPPESSDFGDPTPESR